jgi:hypothetical protein
MSPDDHDFDTIYRSLPSGLIVIACPWNSVETLESFCLSLKGAAIRCGSNAMLFLWGYSRENSKTVGIQHLRNLIEKHQPQGVRLFLVNSSPMNGSINAEISELIQRAALSNEVTVVVTAIAERVAEELAKKDSLPKKSKTSQSKLLMSLKTKLHFGSWKGILLERHRRDDDWYSATAAIGADEVLDEVKRYGPLYFLSECPQPPASVPEPADKSGAEASEGRPLWRRLLRL